MQPTLKINTAGFKRMALELARISGKQFAEIYRLEGGSCIKIAALRGKVASLAAIKRQVAERSGSHHTGDGGEVWINARSNVGRVWFTDDSSHIRGPGGRGYLVYDTGKSQGHRLPDPLWQEYLITTKQHTAYIKARIAELAKRRGLERLSWLQMGDSLGVQLSAVAPQGNLQEGLARGANVHGRQWQNGSAQEQEAGAKFMIVVSNTSPVAIKRDGQARLDRAINQRVRGFEIAAKKGVLSDLQRRAARWPGIFIRPAA